MTEYEFKFTDPLRLPPLGPPTELHRQKVMSLLREAAPRGEGTICVLGAGPCNDLDLRELLDLFAKVHLVDLDANTLHEGVQRQRIPDSFFETHRLELWGNWDVVGIHERLIEEGGNDSPPNEIGGLIEMVQAYCWDGLPRPVDLIASTCLLSQLVSHVVETVGESHSQFVPLIQAIRKHHVQLMIDQLLPGGRGVLIFDFLSSDTLPELVSLTGEPLKKALSAAIDCGNFFHGMNPQMIHHMLETDFRGQITGFQLSPPWVWNAGKRCYAVTAYTFEKSPL